MLKIKVKLFLTIAAYSAWLSCRHRCALPRIGLVVSSEYFAALIICPTPEKCTERELGNEKFPVKELEG